MKTLLLALRLFALPCLLSVLVRASPQIPQPPQPLTQEQIAVYRAFLADFVTEIKIPVRLSDETESFTVSPFDYSRCMWEFKTGTVATIHQLGHQFADLPNIKVVSAEAADETDTVEADSKSGILRMSEILFDSTHHLAALRYSYHCGGLCGRGGTVVFVNDNGKWQDAGRDCFKWIR